MFLYPFDHYIKGIKVHDDYGDSAMKYLITVFFRLSANAQISAQGLFFMVRPLQFNYLSYELQSLEMSHFGIKKKLKNVFFLIFKKCFRVCRLGLVARCF